MLKLDSSIPEIIRLSDGTVIYDSTGELATANPQVKQEAEQLFDRFQRDSFRIQAQAGEQNQAETLQQLQQPLCLQPTLTKHHFQV